MRHLFASVLILGALIPSLTLAVTDESFGGEITTTGRSSSKNFADRNTGGPLVNSLSEISSLSETGQQVGCSAGGNIGGALSNALGVGLQQGLSGLIDNFGGQFVGDIASQAGPFSGLVNLLGQKGLDFLSGQALDVVSDLFPDAADVAKDAAAAVTGGAAGAAASAASAAGGAAGAAAAAGPVPVVETSKELLKNIAHIDKQTTKTERNTDATKTATETLVHKECVLDPTVARILNSILVSITRTNAEWITSGFEGGPAFVTNLNDLALDISDAVFERVQDELLSGMCSPYRQDIQRALLTQYQYETNLGSQVQCKTDEKKLAARMRGDFEGGGGDQGWYENLFNDTTVGAYFKALGVTQKKIASSQREVFTQLDYGDGYKAKVVCTEASINLPGHGICIDGQVVVPAPSTAALANQTLVNSPNDQLLNADEIGEVIDALMAGLTQVAFQSIDGFFSTTRKQKTQGGGSLSYLDAATGEDGGSYLDTAVDTASGGALATGRALLLSDMRGVRNIESEYGAILEKVIDNLQDTKNNYTAVVACYQRLTTTISSTISTQTASERMQSASSTIAQLITPQIRNFALQSTISDRVLDELEIIIAEAESVQTIADLAEVTTRYQTLIAEGNVHTATDLTYLKNDLAAGAIALNTLNVDARAKLAECRRY